MKSHRGIEKKSSRQDGIKWATDVKSVLLQLNGKIESTSFIEKTLETINQEIIVALGRFPGNGQRQQQ